MKVHVAVVAAALVTVSSCGIEYSPSDAPGGAAGAGGEGGSAGTGGSAPTPADRSCERASDCIVIPASCCGSCGVATASDRVAVRAGEESVHRAAACSAEEACPACAGEPDPNLFALCIDGQCEARDVRTSEASACVEDTDCVVIPRACCACGAGDAPGTLVAVRVGDSEFAESLCTEDVGCPECGWDPPSGVSAVCVAERCSVVDERR